MKKRIFICLSCLFLLFTACDEGTSGLPNCDDPLSDRDSDEVMDSAYIFKMYYGEPYYDSIVAYLKNSNEYDRQLDCIETAF